MSFWLEHASIFSSGSCGHHIWRQSPTSTHTQRHEHAMPILKGRKVDLSVSTPNPRRIRTPLCGMEKRLRFVLHTAPCDFSCSFCVLTDLKLYVLCQFWETSTRNVSGEAGAKYFQHDMGYFTSLFSLLPSLFSIRVCTHTHISCIYIYILFLLSSTFSSTFFMFSCSTFHFLNPVHLNFVS